jgi:hypothetical protein
MRNRIKSHRKVRVGDLLPHENNPRLHSETQRQALRALLGEIGFARSVLAYELPGGQLKLIDGHLRKEELDPEQEIDVEILDVSDAEAKRLLLSLDPLAQLADYDAAVLADLRSVVEADSEAVRNLWGVVDQVGRTARERLARAGDNENEPIPEQFLIVVECADEAEQTRLLGEFRKAGITCSAKTV